MDSVIYKWLLLYKNETITTLITQNLIEIVLILSINGLDISYDKLINYYNNIKSNNSDRYGLNGQQFKLLENNINSLIQINNNKENNNNNIVYNNNNKNTFDYIITIIIEKNNKINNIKTVTTIINGNKDLLFYKLWRNIIIRNKIIKYIRLYKIHSNKITFTTFDELSRYRYKSYLKSVNFERYGEQWKIQDIELISPDILPYGLERIIFNGDFNKPIPSNVIPNTVTTIEFGRNLGSDFNQSLGGNWLPSSLKRLKLGRKFQHPIKIGDLPESLTELLLDDYNGIIEPGAIPKSVKNLDYKFCSRDYNPILKTVSPVDKVLSSKSIPKSITKLEFQDFNKPIEQNNIPHNVTSLSFSNDFSSTIDHLAFNNVPLLHLNLGSFSSQFEEGFLSSSITSLTSLRFNHQINNSNILPNSLKILKLNSFNNELKPNILPHSITSLSLYMYSHSINDVNILPNNLTNLELNFFNKPLIPNMFPRSITSLTFFAFDQYINQHDLFPPNLKSLILCYFNKPLEIFDVLPKSLTSIQFQNFNHPIPQGYFFNYKNLKSLSFSSFNNDIPIKTLPDSLTELKHFNYDKPFNKNMFSESSLISKLVFYKYNHEIEFDQFPSSITSLSFGFNFDKSIGNGVLPKSLKELSILNPYYDSKIPMSDQLPDCLESIFILPQNRGILNNLTSNFIAKYIKIDPIPKLPNKILF